MALLILGAPLFVAAILLISEGIPGHSLIHRWQIPIALLPSLALAGGVLALGALLFGKLAWDSIWYPYNSEGRYFDGIVDHEADAVIGYFLVSLMTATASLLNWAALVWIRKAALRGVEHTDIPTERRELDHLD